MLMKIGEVTQTFGLSHRTLRFWEEAGLIESQRTEGGFRLYDEANLRRIRQAMVLRGLNLSLADIEEIFRSNQIATAVSVLKRHVGRLDRQSRSLRAIRLALDHLLRLLREQNNLENMFSAIAPEDVRTPAALSKALAVTARKASETTMNQDEILIQNDLRIVKLPAMVFAAASADGEEPENASWAKVRKLVEEHGLDKLPGYRNFGYGYNRASDGQYVYVNWVVVPETLELPPEFEKVRFRGGLFAVLPCTLLNIGERWNELFRMVNESEAYEHDPHRPQSYCLEEVLDPESFHAPQAKFADMQLDLFAAIRKVGTKENAPIGDAETVEVPGETLLGSWFTLSKPVKPSRVSVPWYRLAQSLYRLGPSLPDYLDRGQDTFAYLHYSLIDTDMERCRVDKVFAAVRLKKIPDVLPEDLILRKTEPRQALKVTARCQPGGDAAEKIDLKALFEKGSESLASGCLKELEEEFLWRDYRPDGHHVQTVEIYFFAQ